MSARGERVSVITSHQTFVSFQNIQTWQLRPDTAQKPPSQPPFQTPASGGLSHRAVGGKSSRRWADGAEAAQGRFLQMPGYGVTRCCSMLVISDTSPSHRGAVACAVACARGTNEKSKLNLACLLV